jgi:peptidoglycan hydrolase CwlO-like protein|tara:strand:- start:354 stop:572 length:219 start_codon:yes stop_codon:yes gene_type:complete
MREDTKTQIAKQVADLAGIIAALDLAKDDIDGSRESLSKRLKKYNDELATIKENLNEITWREDDAWLTGGNK